MSAGGSRSLSTRVETARILRVTQSRLRTFERMDLVRPAGGEGEAARFDFRDLLSLRALVGLLDRGISMRRIRRSVERVRERWPIALRVGRHTSSVAQTLDTWTEFNADRAVVARNIPRYAELVNLQDFRRHPTLDERLRPVDDRLVLDDVVAAALVTVVLDADRLAADLAHEAGILPAMRFIEPDKFATELPVEDVRQHEDWRRNLEPGESRRRRKAFDALQNCGDIRAWIGTVAQRDKTGLSREEAYARCGCAGSMMIVCVTGGA